MVLWHRKSFVSLLAKRAYWTGKLSWSSPHMTSNSGRARLTLALLLAIATPVHADAQADYMLHCGGCHLLDGSGMPPVVPSLRDDLGRIITVAQGRGYLVRVPGVSQAMLDDAGLAAVINWVLTEFNSATLPDDFEALTAREVKEARRNVLMDPLKLRAELWRRYKGI